MTKLDRSSIADAIVDAGTGIRIIHSELMLLQQLLNGGTTAISKPCCDIPVIQRNQNPRKPRGCDSIIDMGTRLLIINAELRVMQGHWTHEATARQTSS
jgi:hypothetical protein